MSNIWKVFFDAFNKDSYKRPKPPAENVERTRDPERDELRKQRDNAHKTIDCQKAVIDNKMMVIAAQQEHIQKLESRISAVELFYAENTKDVDVLFYEIDEEEDEELES